MYIKYLNVLKSFYINQIFRPDIKRNRALNTKHYKQNIRKKHENITQLRNNGKRKEIIMPYSKRIVQ